MIDKTMESRADHILRIAKEAGLDPFAQGRDRRDVTGALAALQDRYFPDVRPKPGASSELQPHTYVFYRSPGELAVARSVQPPGVQITPVLLK